MSVVFNPFTGTFDFVGAPATGGGGGAVDSVNGQTGDVILTTDDISEGSTNKYFTLTRSRESVSGIAPITYNTLTGEIGITQATSGTNGYLSASDFQTFNSKQPFILAGNVTDYWRGDKTFQTLDTAAVIENPINLYFTGVRARAAITGVLVDNGSAAFPTYGFANEPGQDTGMFRITDMDGHIGWSSQGVQVMDLKPGGDLTIAGNFTAAGNISAANYPPNGDANHFAIFNDTGSLTAATGWFYDTWAGGANVNLNVFPFNPPGGETRIFENFVNSIFPQEDTPDLNYQGIQNYTYLNGPYRYANFTGLNNGVATPAEGHKGNITLLNQSLDLGDDTNESTSDFSNLLNQYVNVHGLHNVNGNITPINSSLSVFTNGRLSNANLFNTFMQVDPGGTVTGGVNLLNFGLTLYGASPTAGVIGVNNSCSIQAPLNFYSGYVHNTRFEASGVCNSNISAYGDNFNGASGASCQGYTGMGMFQNFFEGFGLGNGFTGISINPNVSGYMDGGINIGTFGGNYYSSMNYANGITVGPQLRTGAFIQNGITVISDNTRMEAGVQASYYTGYGGFPTFEPGCSVTGGISLINVNPNVQANLPSMTLGQFGIGGGGSVNNLIGLQVNLGGFSSANQKVGLQINDGSLNAFYPFQTSQVTPQIASTIHSLGGTFQVDAGFPVTGGQFVFGDLFSVQPIFFDDMGPDIIGGVIGYTQVAAVGQTTVAAGKTVDTFNFIAAGGSIPSIPGDGGTFTNVTLVRAIGLLPAGGNLNITNLYGFKADGFLSALGPANVWGIHVSDSNADNFFSKSVTIGGSTGKTTNADIGLEIASKKAIQLASMTTTEINAIASPQGGMLVYDNVLGKLTYYDGVGNTWVNL